MDGIFQIEKALMAAAISVVVPPAVSTGGAKACLQSVLPSGFSAFSSGQYGNFPYYWKNPSDFKFNDSSYNWISAGIKPNANPTQLDGVFANRFISVLSSIVYTLSTTDQASLNNAYQLITDKQRQLLQAWYTAFGSFPNDQRVENKESECIDLILGDIVTLWAYPPTDLVKLSNAKNLSDLLNKIPSDGNPVVNKLNDFLTATKEITPLLNELSRNNGLLRRALDNVMNPDNSNGGLLLSGRERCVPRYEVMTELDDIIRGLSSNNFNRTVSIKLSAMQRGDGNLDVSVINDSSASSPVTLALSELLGFSKDTGNNLLRNTFNSENVTLTAEFGGATEVSFRPASFSIDKLTNWFWIDPIKEALRNGTNDVSGFKFKPFPPFDFNTKGQFGFVTSVLITRNPSISIDLPATMLRNNVAVFNEIPPDQLSFLGRSLGSYTVTSKTTQNTNKLELNNILSGSLTDQRAFVLGVKTCFLSAGSDEEALA